MGLSLVTEAVLTRALGGVALLVSLLTLSGCLASLSSTGNSGSSMAAAVPCEQPRPRVCTMEYLPVCAALSAGDKKTYASGCNACADIAVSSYVDGACETDGQ